MLFSSHRATPSRHVIPLCAALAFGLLTQPHSIARTAPATAPAFTDTCITEVQMLVSGTEERWTFNCVNPCGGGCYHAYEESGPTTYYWCSCSLASETPECCHAALGMTYGGYSFPAILGECGITGCSSVCASDYVEDYPYYFWYAGCQ
jgi:hypothetical protein